MTNLDNALPPDPTEKKGEIYIHDHCQNGTSSVHHIRVVNTDDNSHSGKPQDKFLQEAERAKKQMYLEACLQQLRHFSLFVALVDGLLGVEATETLKRISSCLEKKWRQPYSRTCGYVKSMIAITLVRATHRYIQGSRVPTHRISVQHP